MDTGSPWILANNPRAPYWDGSPGDPLGRLLGIIAKGESS